MNQSVKFDKIVPEGKALGYLGGRACFAIGPLPGETASVEVIKDKKTYVEVAVREITTASRYRQAPAEAHYLSCSPWQGVDYDYQLELKRQILTETFARPELKLPVGDVIGAPHEFGYRNKLEFSLLASSDKQLSLAFHARNSLTDLIALPEGCRLGSDAMNAAALSLLGRVNQLNISGYIETLTVRQSQTSGQIVGIVAVHQVPKRDWSMLMVPELSGVVVSRVRSRNQHELVWSDGQTKLSEFVGGVTLEYAYDGFFQTNVPMFEQTLRRILEAVPAGSQVVDLYGGAGTIGLPAAKIARNVVGIEINPAAVESATNNAAAAGLANYRGVAVPAERLDPELLAGRDVVIVDPPRAGLHQRVIGHLLAAAPARIIYLSCNPVTQARDAMMLGGAYKASAVTGFDFYPGTLHLESLMVFDKIV